MEMYSFEYEDGTLSLKSYLLTIQIFLHAIVKRLQGTHLIVSLKLWSYLIVYLAHYERPITLFSNV